MYTLPQKTGSSNLPTLDATLTNAIIRNIPKIDNGKNMVSGTTIGKSEYSDSSLPFHDRSVRVSLPSDYVTDFFADSVRSLLAFCQCCSLFLRLCHKLLYLLTMLLAFPSTLSEIALPSDYVAGFSADCQKSACLLTVLLAFPSTLSEVGLSSDYVAGFSCNSVRS